ncbi:pre-mRNA-splicing factor syf1 [Maudiozyma exigua]|uniref:Pre-mRNA-splicing factor SYF1 n=1 Tax=Maudiozyma exigua TaxID=34358 RepID=A0A9P6WBG2_MAUEX|nr:pre-mRNA-splicing factor syf1 [Kazachstania exigua]
MEEINKYVKDDEDIAYEYELQKSPDDIQAWVHYLDRWKEQNKNGQKSNEGVLWLFRRYVNQFINNVDVWFVFITWMCDSYPRMNYMDISTLYNEGIENCGIKSEKLCLKYLKFAIEKNDLALIRQAFDISLSSLSKNLHYKLWEQLLIYIRDTVIPLIKTADQGEKSQADQFSDLIRNILKVDNETSNTDEDPTYRVNIWVSAFLERYLIVCPKDEVVDTLLLLGGTNDTNRIKTLFEKYLLKGNDFKNKSEVKDIPYSLNIVYLNALYELNESSRCQKFIDVLNELYSFNHTPLALITGKYFMKNGKFDELESHLDQLLINTTTVDDFGKVSKFHTDFEVALIECCLKVIDDSGEQEELSKLLEVHLAKLGNLTKHHDIQLNDLYLRKNPNNVRTWSERVNLKKSLKQKSDVYTNGILTVDPLKVKEPGALGKFWSNYAQLYWRNNDLDSAREIFEKALNVPFPYMKDLEIIWMTWIENELRINNVDRVFTLLREALKIPENAIALLEQYENPQNKVPTKFIMFHSLKLWVFYLDLIESRRFDVDFKGSESYRENVEIYENMIRLNVITPLLYVTYAKLARKFDDIRKSFQIYNRAISSFPPEIKFDIWLLYLKDALKSRLPVEQIRDLFNEALSQLVPHDIDCISIYLLNNEYEEGLSGVTEVTISKLIKSAKELSGKYIESKLKLWDLALEKTKSHFGLEMARPLYEDCITIIPRDKSPEYIVSFAKLEATVGEIVRAREILQYGAQLVPPVRNELLWNYWEQLEISNGDKERYKDMLKLKKKLEEEMKVDTEEVSQETGNIEFVAAKKIDIRRSAPRESNPNEIDLDL